jgi:hypothetical protein
VRPRIAAQEVQGCTGAAIGRGGEAWDVLTEWDAREMGAR